RTPITANRAASGERRDVACAAVGERRLQRKRGNQSRRTAFAASAARVPRPPFRHPARRLLRSFRPTALAPRLPDSYHSNYCPNNSGGCMAGPRVISLPEFIAALRSVDRERFWNVLTEDYFTGELVPGSRWVPLDRIGRDVAARPVDRTGTIIV